MGSGRTVLVTGAVILPLFIASGLGVDRVDDARVPTDSISPPVAEDVNPDPDIVEIRLIAEEAEVDYGIGTGTTVWTYEGGVPGPTIEAEVGNTLIVHFVNRLPEPTTVHWHGVETPADMDGSHVSQIPVQPGEYFRYEFRLLHASTFWYHPHVQSHVQVEKGLYGALVVRDPAEDAALDLPGEEHILILDDVLLDNDGNVAEPWAADPLENAELQVNGREGNVLLVNGVPNRMLAVERGVPQRLRVINASNARFMTFSIDNHVMWRIGGDQGLLEVPIEIQPLDPEIHTHQGGLTLTPGERADVVFTPRGTEPINLGWFDVHRGRHRAFHMDGGAIGLGHAFDDGSRPPRVMMTFMPEGAEDATDYVPPAELRDIEPIDVSGARSIPVTFGHTMPDAAGNVTFFAQMKDGMPLPAAAVTESTAPTVEVGETAIWEVTNLTGGMHNFHSHGFSFQLIETELVDLDVAGRNRVIPAPYAEIKDTIMLRARPGDRGRSRTITRLAVHFTEEGREGRITASGIEPTEDASGGWAFHCHLLEHAALGMMSFLQVVDSLPLAAEDASVGLRPSTTMLQPNYPNPFASTTTIRYVLPTAADVDVGIYNLLGQRVATLRSGQQSPGKHAVEWDATGYPSGIYHVRLGAGDREETRQVVVRR